MCCSQIAADVMQAAPVINSVIHEHKKEDLHDIASKAVCSGPSSR